MRFYVFHTRLRIAVHLESSANVPVAISPRHEDVITIGREASVAGRKKQKFPAFAFVRTCIAKVRDVAKPKIVNEAKCVRWALDDNRSALQVDPRRDIDAFGIG